MKPPKARTPSDSEPLVVRHTCEAARERVFAAFTSVERLALWYTPDIANPVVFERFDFRVGGGYRVAFGAPAGEAPYVEEATYLEIEAPARLVMETVLTHAGAVLARTHNTIELIERGARTELVMTELGCPPEARDDRFGGWSRTFANLPRALQAARATL